MNWAHNVLTFWVFYAQKLKHFLFGKEPANARISVFSKSDSAPKFSRSKTKNCELGRVAVRWRFRLYTWKIFWSTFRTRIYELWTHCPKLRAPVHIELRICMSCDKIWTKEIDTVHTVEVSLEARGCWQGKSRIREGDSEGCIVRVTYFTWRKRESGMCHSWIR